MPIVPRELSVRERRVPETMERFLLTPGPWFGLEDFTSLPGAGTKNGATIGLFCCSHVLAYSSLGQESFARSRA